VDAEARLGASVIDALRERGHDVTVVADWSLSRLCAAGRTSAGLLQAAADARGMMRYAAGR
jgi:gamma-glutamyltranspeptidase/glutathione hydrolase